MAYSKKELERTKHKLRQTLKSDKFIEKHSNESTHLSDRHIDVPTANHIDRVLDTKTDKPTLLSTSFESEKQMIKLVKETLKDENNLHELAKWLLSDTKKELQITEHYKDQQTTGKGIQVNPQTRKIAEYDTRSLTIRIAKNSTMPDGFAIVTAFPLLDKHATPTNRDLSNDMQQTNAYQNANPIDKTLYDLVCRPDFDTETFSVGTAGPGNNHHTLYLSQQDPNENGFTHRFSFNAKKCLFTTYKTMDPTRTPVQSDFISDKDKFNAISKYHNPQGMLEVYQQLPELGVLIEHGYNQLQQHIKDDPEYRKQVYKQKTKTEKSTTKPVKENEQQTNPEQKKPEKQSKEQRIKMAEAKMNITEPTHNLSPEDNLSM